MAQVHFHVMQGVISNFIPIFSHSQFTHQWVVSHSQVTWEWVIRKLLCPSNVIWKMFPHEKTIKSGLWLIDDHGESHTRPLNELRPACKELTTKRGFSCELITRARNWQVPRPFLKVTYSHGTCVFQWWVPLSYCEYSGVTYDLLMSNIGRT